MNANLIIEGPTRCGKSSLIAELYNRLDEKDYITHHFGFPLGKTNEEKYFYQWGQFEMAMRWTSKMNELGVFSVLDRSWIGERVWSPRYRSIDPESMLRCLERAFLPQFGSTKFILLQCSYEEVERRRSLTKDTRPFMSKVEWETLQNDFVSAFEMTMDRCYNESFKFITIDTTHNSTETILNVILKED